MGTLFIIVLAVILFFGLTGYVRGFLKMILSIVSLALTLYAATLISPYISAQLQKTNLYTTVYESTYNYVEDKIVDSAASGFEGAMDALELPDIIKQYVTQKEVSSDIVENSIHTAGSTIAAMVAAQLTSYVFDTLVFIITFFAAQIAVRLLIMALDIVSKLPVINGINKIAGLAAGLCEGVVIVWILFLFVGMLGSSEFVTQFYKQINENAVLTFLYNNNIIMNALFK
jgi:hypothetical protein